MRIISKIRLQKSILGKGTSFNLYGYPKNNFDTLT